MAQDLKAQNPVPTPHTPRQHDERIPSHDELHEMKKTAAQGVVIVAVPQLFPTPPELADRMSRLEPALSANDQDLLEALSLTIG